MYTLSTNLNMKNLATTAGVISVTAFLFLGGTGPANAQFRNGVNSTNRIETGTTWSRSNLNIEEIENFNSSTIQEAEGFKVQLSSFGPDAFAGLNFDGEKFTGYSFASTDPLVPDPVATGLYEEFSVIYEATTDRQSTVTGTVESGTDGVYTNTVFDNSIYLD